MAPAFNAAAYSIELKKCSCAHNTDNSTQLTSAYPNISCIHAELYQHETTPSGAIRASLLNKHGMDDGSPSAMWAECQAYDAAHMPTTQLNKVENYLANESFSPDRQRLLDQANGILYLDEACIYPGFRGNRLSLIALDLLMKELGVGEEYVILLQAGSIVRFDKDPRTAGLNALEACEKIAAHWRKMGFSEWSDSDDAWLCLWSGAVCVGEQVAKINATGAEVDMT